MDSNESPGPTVPSDPDKFDAVPGTIPDAPLTIGLGRMSISAFSPTMTPQDLSADSFVHKAPRVKFGESNVPALGGILLLAKLGQGGMGAVYYGIHPRLKREVAVKVLPFHLAEKNPTTIERFFREAQVAANIHSPHLVAVADVNEECGLHYLVMEFVRGRSAQECIRAAVIAGEPGLKEADVLQIGVAAATGLAVAHADGIVHRDIKPDNILIPKHKNSDALNYEAAKLADLGLARAAGDDLSLTQTGQMMGTPGYMSPEQYEDTKSCGPAADVFSFGATLYAMLAGAPPFIGNTLVQVARSTAERPHPPIQKQRPDVSKKTAAVIEKCLEKQASRRYATAAEMLAALKDCAAIPIKAAPLEKKEENPPVIIEDIVVRKVADPPVNPFAPSISILKVVGIIVLSLLVWPLAIILGIGFAFTQKPAARKQFLLGWGWTAIIGLAAGILIGGGAAILEKSYSRSGEDFWIAFCVCAVAGFALGPIAGYIRIHWLPEKHPDPTLAGLAQTIKMNAPAAAENPASDWRSGIVWKLLLMSALAGVMELIACQFIDRLSDYDYNYSYYYYLSYCLVAPLYSFLGLALSLRCNISSRWRAFFWAVLWNAVCAAAGWIYAVAVYYVLVRYNNRPIAAMVEASFSLVPIAGICRAFWPTSETERRSISDQSTFRLVFAFNAVAIVIIDFINSSSRNMGLVSFAPSFLALAITLYLPYSKSRIAFSYGCLWTIFCSIAIATGKLFLAEQLRDGFWSVSAVGSIGAPVVGLLRAFCFPLQPKAKEAPMPPSS